MRFKRTLFLLLLMIFLFSAAACNSFAAGEEAGLVYTDPQLEMFIYISAPGWEGSKDNEQGVVYFEKKKSDYTIFAISSNITREAGKSAEELKEEIGYYWDYSKSGMEQGFASFEWRKEPDIKAGEYDAARYHFIGDIGGNEGIIEGDYFYWWTDSRLYICSFTALTEDYAVEYETLKDALLTFETYDEMEEKAE